MGRYRASAVGTMQAPKSRNSGISQGPLRGDSRPFQPADVIDENFRFRLTADFGLTLLEL